MTFRSSSRTKIMSSTLSPNHFPSVLDPASASPSPGLSTSPTPEPQRRASRSPSIAKESTAREGYSGITHPITYTPTTNRISKAKKGKRVHACEYPGCDKVFTRAEHKRRHELNHNPKAYFRCTHHGCQKVFRRSDLLARHIERHALEGKGARIAEWEAPMRTAAISGCIPVAPNRESFLAPAQPPTSVSTGSPMTPNIHPEPPANSLMWSGTDISLQSGDAMFHYHAPDSAGGSPFYSSPAETCPSPLSDGATLSVSPNLHSSVLPAPTVAIDPYPGEDMKTDLVSSPPMHASLRCWDSSDLNMSNMVVALDGDLIQPELPCSYPAGWGSADCVSYNENSSAMNCKAWSF